MTGNVLFSRLFKGNRTFLSLLQQWDWFPLLVQCWNEERDYLVRL